MQTLSEIKSLLAEHNLAPRKSLGQNFLVDHNLIRKLADAAAVGSDSLILEVGPGTGALTEELLSRHARVIACELDEGLAGLLEERLGSSTNFTLVRGDCLSSKHSLNPALAAALADRPFTLVANLPYGAATPLLLTLLIDHPPCRAMFITVQRELADRLLAPPGSRDYGPLSITARALTRIDRIATLPPECFWPRPDVTSAMVSLTRLETPLTGSPRRLLETAQHLFAQRRKQIGKALGTLGLPPPFPAGITPTQRAEDLTIDQFLALAQAAPSR